MRNPFRKTSSAARRAEQPRPAPAAPATPRATPRGERRVFGVLTAPHLTEKTNRLQAGGWYAFQVRANASKVEIRRAVQDRYGVSVRAVRTVRGRSRAVRLGRTRGRRSSPRRAMVRLAAGQSIEVL